MSSEASLAASLVGQSLPARAHTTWWLSPCCPGLQDCIICMEKLASPSGYGDACECSTIKPEMVGRLTSCQHSFHMLCVLAMYSNGNKVPSWPSTTSSACPASW